MSEGNTGIMGQVVRQLSVELSDMMVECAALVGWPEIFRAVREAALSTEDDEVAFVAQDAASRTMKKERSFHD